MPLTQPLRDPQMRCSVYNHAMSRRWYAAAAILSGGLALRWLRDLFGLNDYAHLSQLAAEIPRGAQGLVFLPYLAGERTPHLDPQASGMFLGLRLYHQRGHLARAVMEGVCFAMRDCLDLVSSLHDGPVEIIASGGAATSPVWQQIQADIYEHPLLLGHGEHHACVGAALLAGVGAGVYSSIEEAVQQIPRSSTVVTPDSESAAFYAERRELYRSLYPTLRDAMHRLSES
jgi:xylulokinase